MVRRLARCEDEEAYLDEHDLVTIAVKRLGWELAREAVMPRHYKLSALGDATTLKQKRKLAEIDKLLAMPEPDWEEVVLEEKRLNPPKPRKPETPQSRKAQDAAVIKLSLHLERQMADELEKDLAKKNKKRKAQP